MKFEEIPQKIRDEMMFDEWIFGHAFCLKENGKYKRIDPMTVTLKSNGEWEIKNEVGTFKREGSRQKGRG